jgi:hypothetical protein
VNVGKRCGTKTITQDEINALMIEHARAKTAAWCASRAAIRCCLAALQKRWMRWTPMPASPSRCPRNFCRVCRCRGIGRSLTDREWASNVIFSTGHHAQSHNREAPLPALEDATRVVYMPGRDLELCWPPIS